MLKKYLACGHTLQPYCIFVKFFVFFLFEGAAPVD